jgi:Tol biopolymer transport system component
LRSTPDGARIAFLMRDDAGIVQVWTISPNGGKPQQLTRNPFDVASAFSWSPDGRSIAYIADGSVFVTDATSRESSRLTPRVEGSMAPRPEACVFSPDGRRIAYVRPVVLAAEVYNQIFVVTR